LTGLNIEQPIVVALKQSDMTWEHAVSFQGESSIARLEKCAGSSDWQVGIETSENIVLVAEDLHSDETPDYAYLQLGGSNLDMSQEGQPEISGDSLFMVALSVSGSAYDLVLLEVDLFLRATTVAGQFDNRSSAGLVANQVHINSFFTLAQASRPARDPPPLRRQGERRCLLPQLLRPPRPLLHPRPPPLRLQVLHRRPLHLDAAGLQRRMGLLCGHKADSTSGVYFFMLELGDQSEILRSVEIIGFEDSSMTN